MSRKLASSPDYAEIVTAGRHYVGSVLNAEASACWGASEVLRFIRISYLGGVKQFLTDHGFHAAAA